MREIGCFFKQPTENMSKCVRLEVRDANVGYLLSIRTEQPNAANREAAANVSEVRLAGLQTTEFEWLLLPLSKLRPCPLWAGSSR